jgi:tryptophan-rich sensory protein
MHKWLKLIASILLCQLAGLIGSLTTFSEITGWYVTLAKPFFTPPNWVFGPVWLALYTLMGISFWFIWQKKPNKKTKTVMRIFAMQLALNALWSIVFFGFHSLLGGMILIILLWLLILICIIRFYEISKPAGWLLVPYIIWVTIATALNAGVWLLN